MSDLNNEQVILTVDFEDGRREKRLLLAIFPAENKRSYAALLPLDDNGNPIPWSAVELVRATPFVNEDGKDDYTVDSIKSDLEFDYAKAAFDKLGLSSAEPAEPEAISESEKEDAEDLSELPPLPSVFLTDAQGAVSEWQIVDLFTAGQRQYAALFSIDGVTEDGGQIVLFRAEEATQDGQDGLMLNPIPTDEELAIARDALMGRL